MALSVIIPCKTEALNIERCIRRVEAAWPGAEILVVDSGLDHSKEIVNQLNRELPNVIYVACMPDRGKGDAIAQGIRRSTQDLILQIDADLQFWPEDIPTLLAPILENKADMVLGSRFLPASKQLNKNSPVIRSFGNRLFSLYSSLLYGQKISDALAGFKAWRREVTQSFTLSSYSFTYEIELFAKALKKNWRVVDVPVHYEAREFGESQVPLFKTGLRIFRDGLKFRWDRS